MNLHLLESLQPRDRKAIQAFMERLGERYSQRVLQAILFGSKARGDSHADSDIDILLVMSRADWRVRHTVSDIASDVSLEHDVLIGPRVIERERWERMARERSGLYENVRREGIPLISDHQPPAGG